MASRKSSFHEQSVAGVLLVPLKWLCISVMILLGLIVTASIVDWVFVLKVWPDGIARLQRILQQDLARTCAIECWCGDLQGVAVGAANIFYDLIFRLSGIHDMGVRFAQDRALSIPDTVVRNFYAENFEGIQVAILATQLIGVRLATLIAALPLTVLVYGLAMNDGLAQRAIRRASGGRESSGIYHRARYLLKVLLVSAMTTFLLWPFSIDVLAICGITLGIAAVLVRVQWTYYKKHL